MSILRRHIDLDTFKTLNWTGRFDDYLSLVRDNPDVSRNAFQRLYDMILTWGTSEHTRHKERLVHYKFFDDPIDGGRDAIFGLDKPLMRLINLLKAGAHAYGPERRVILLHGPVGSAKSTVARLLKKGLELYSQTDEGALYTFGWWDEKTSSYVDCPMHEEPLLLIPYTVRERVLSEILQGQDLRWPIKLDGELCPSCRMNFREILTESGGDWLKVIDKVQIRRLVLSEKDRVGIGTFQPKDEKNQDSTELTGDINYRKIAEYGTDSDPRAFNFDGELNIANRGLVEFIEILKLDVAFLYDLLGATQEHKIKPKKFAQTDIDEVIIGHTNEPEYRKLQSNELMEAFRDRTVKIDMPYNTRLDDEIKIYKKDFNDERVRGKHIAPHTVEISSMWALLTRLEEPKKADLTLMQKLKLYNGKSLPGYTEDNVRELREDTEREGMEGISPRYIQDKISNALVRDDVGGCVNPFMALNELEEGLSHHSLITNEDQRKSFKERLAMVKEEYEDIVKNEVQKAISADEEAIARLCANYIDHVKAYTQKEKVRNKYTGQDEEPDERLMRSIEEKIGVQERTKDDFRGEIMNYIGALAIDGKQFNYWTNERLQKALELKLFEDQKDMIRIVSGRVTSVLDKDSQEKINIIKSRLKKNYAYCDECAEDILDFVASIFARGDVKSKK